MGALLVCCHTIVTKRSPATDQDYKNVMCVTATSFAKPTRRRRQLQPQSHTDTELIAMEQIKVIIGRDKAAPSVTTSESLAKTCPSLSRSQRLIGFASCFCLGYLISFGSTFALIGGSANGAKFGITYSIGNVIALCGSGFLVGPKEQVKLMMKPVRRVAAVIYLAMIVVVLSVAIAAPNLGGLVLFLVFIQFVAAVWYSASYIPYGRKILTGICKKTCGGTME